MTTLTLAVRIVALLCFGAPLLLRSARRAERSATDRSRRTGSWAPVAANFAVTVGFMLALWRFTPGRDGASALPLAFVGAGVAGAGAVLILRARVVLGAAWSLVPAADPAAGLITTGPYRLVRHPIYLGLTLLAIGNAVAFTNGPAAAIVLCGLVPTFAWRARAEEAVLSRAFGEPYARYRDRTTMFIPYLL